MHTTTLQTGLILYHGTDCDDFQEAVEALEGPAWLSSSRSVAEHFARRAQWGGVQRIVVYQVRAAQTVYEITTSRELQHLADEFDLSLHGPDEIRNSVEASGIPGWRIPFNYPDGDDILLAHCHTLEYVRTETLA